MMIVNWTVFVEGESARAFLRCFLERISVANIETVRIDGGVSKLQEMEPTIRRRHDSGNRIAILPDADRNPSERRIQFQKQRDSLQLPISDDDCFLLPNDTDSGDLETLLEQISVAQHRVIYDCFQQYEGCLQNESDLYHVPNSKARIFAYCEALNIETHASRRDYGDAVFWNLSAPELDPLKRFLLGLHAKR